MRVFHWGFLHLCSSEILAYNFFLVEFLFAFGIRILLVLQEEFGRVPSSSVFDISEGLLLILWIFGRIHLWRCLVLNFCLLKGCFFLKLLIQFPCSIQSVQILFSITVSVLISYTFLGICLSFIGSPICWYIVVHSSLLESLYFCSIGCNISSLISGFIYLSPLFSFGVSS